MVTVVRKVRSGSNNSRWEVKTETGVVFTVLIPNSKVVSFGQQIEIEAEATAEARTVSSTPVEKIRVPRAEITPEDLEIVEGVLTASIKGGWMFDTPMVP